MPDNQLSISGDFGEIQKKLFGKALPDSVDIAWTVGNDEAWGFGLSKGIIGEDSKNPIDATIGVSTSFKVITWDKSTQLPASCASAWLADYLRCSLHRDNTHIRKPNHDTNKQFLNDCYWPIAKIHPLFLCAAWQTFNNEFGYQYVLQ